MANRPPSGPRFQIPTVARSAPPQPRPRPPPPPPSPLASAVPTPFRPPPPSPPAPAPQIPTNGITTSNSSPKSTVKPDSTTPSSSSDKKSPPASSSRGDIPNAYSAADAISHNVNVVQTSPDQGESIIAPPPSPLTLPPPLLTTTTQDNHDQTSLLTMEVAKHKNKTSPAAENSSRHQQQQQQQLQQQQHYYAMKTNQKIDPELNKDKRGMMSSCTSSIVTLAGENRGATMEFGKNHKNNRGNSTDSNNGGHATNKKGQMDHVYMINSNVQGVNNSIVYGSSYSHTDPGVHVKVLRKRNGGND